MKTKGINMNCEKRRDNAQKPWDFRPMVLSAVVLASSALFSGTYHWKGGTDRLWRTAANWAENAVPTASDDVVINADATDSGGSDVVEFDNYQAVSVRNLTIKKSMNFQQGRINLGGDMVIEYGCVLRMTGSWNAYSIYLPAGDHAIDCRGASGNNNNSNFDWPVVVGGPGTLIKRGTGNLKLPEQYSGTSTWGALDVGGVEVYEGAFYVSNRHLPNVTNIVVDGATARLFPSATTDATRAGAQDAINHGAVVKVMNGGKISDSNSGLSYTVKELWTDDGQCAAGTYTASTLPDELGTTISIAVTDNPPPSTYHWKGGTDRLWTTAANWVEQKVPKASDDVVINADATDSGGSDIVEFDNYQTVSVRNLTIRKTMNFQQGRINLGGDMTIADGCKLKMTGTWNTYSIYLSEGDHEIDCEGTGGSNNNDFVWSVIVGGSGTLIKRGPGNFKLPEQYSGTSTWGALNVGGVKVYEGALYVNNHHLPNVTNIVVDGATARLFLAATTDATRAGAQDAINHDAVVKILNGGKISDSNSGLSYTVKELHVDGAVRLAGTYAPADLPANLGGGISLTVTDVPYLLRVGANSYKDLQAAFDAVQDGGTVTLLESFPFTATLAVTNKTGIVLDLNGKIATYSGNGYLAQIAGSSMSVVDSSVAGSGRLLKVGSGTMIEVGSQSSSSALTLASGAIVFAGANTGASDGACVKVKNGLFTMDGGSLDNGNDPAESSIRVCNVGTAVFNGGTVTGPLRDNEGGTVTVPVMLGETLNGVCFSVNPGGTHLSDPVAYRFKLVNGWYSVVRRRGTIFSLK